MVQQNLRYSKVAETYNLESKEEWKTRSDFFLTCLSYCVGLGNLWRFPHLCYVHHGLTFMIPYFLFMAVIGVPLSIFEGCLGQFTGKDCINVWNFLPIFKGIGYGQSILCFIGVLYYNVIISYALIYLWYSIPSFSGFLKNNFVLVYSKSSTYCQDFLATNHTNHTSTTTCSEDVYNKLVLHNSDNFSDFTLNWKITVCTLVVWIAIYFTVFKNLKSISMVTYFTAIVPYVCLTCLILVALNLDGATLGLRQLFTVDWKYLISTPQLWLDAAIQIFFSNGLAFGVLLNYSSHNNFNTDIFTYSWKLTLMNSFTSVYGSLVIFCTLGFLSLDLHQGNEELAYENFGQVVSSSYKLAFVVYPVAIAKMPVAWLWGCVFFFMIFMLGLGSQIGTFMCYYEALREKLKNHISHEKLLPIMIAICFVLGYPLMTNSGIQYVEIWDNTLCSFSCFIFSFVELFAIGYFYGIDKFFEDIEFMINYRIPKTLFKILWCGLTPILCSLLLLQNLFRVIRDDWRQGGINLEGEVEIPNWPWYAELLGWCIQGFQILPLLICLKNWKQRNAHLNEHYKRRDNNI